MTEVRKRADARDRPRYRVGGGLPALLSAALVSAAMAQMPVAPEDLARLKADYLASRPMAADQTPGRRVIDGVLTAALTEAVVPEEAGGRGDCDLYVGLQPTGNGFWLWTLGGSEVVYWALDDGKMGSGAAAAGGGHVTEYEFSFGLHADFSGDTLRPYVIVSFYNAPYDPVAQATNPVVEPPAPVSSIGWLFNPITLPAPGFYSVRSGLIDLAALGLGFDLDETFYVEILPAEWSSYPAGAPVLDPDVFAMFTGPGTVTYGTNQNTMWSDLWVLDSSCNIDWGDGDGFYDHPEEMDACNDPVYRNQSGIILRGLECTGANTLALSINEPEDICVKPGEPVTVTLSQSCLPGLVRGYQAFLSFDTNALTFVSGSYFLPDPYGLAIIDPIVADGGNIDMAAGIDDLNGQPMTSATADLVQLSFIAGPAEGLTQVIFRAHDPPTRFSDEEGEEVVPTLVDSPPICVDGTPPSIKCPPDPNLQCMADIPPPATNYTQFVAQGGIAVDDGCWGPIAPTVTYQGGSDNGGAGCPGSPLIICRTYRATDCAGNYAECVQTITVIDDTPPEVTNCPGSMVVTPEAGECEAEVSWTAPTVSDNCGGAVTLEYLIDLGNNGSVEHIITVTTFTFPVGTHRVTVKATDDCGNVNNTCSFLVTVNAFNELLVSVELQSFAAGPVTRCITFELWNCTTNEKAVVEQELTFAGGVATGVVPVPCGSYDCITARDRLHTLRRTDEGFGIIGTQYVADFTGNPASGGDWLIGGNLNDDKWIDILDFGVYSWQYMVNATPGANTTCATPYPHADISGDGIVGIADFSFIQINFLKGHEANCCGQPGLDEQGPLMEISVAELHRRGLGHLAVADLNRDGWVDAADIVAYFSGVRPQRPESQSPAPPLGEQKD